MLSAWKQERINGWTVCVWMGGRIDGSLMAAIGGESSQSLFDEDDSTISPECDRVIVHEVETSDTRFRQIGVENAE